MMRQTIRSTVTLAARAMLAFALALSFMVPVAIWSGPAHAQERQRPNLLDVLRGKPRRVTPPDDPRRVRRVQRQKPKRATTTRRATRKAAPRRAAKPARRAAKRKPAVRKPAIRKQAAAPAAAPVVEKVENAAKILVIGDFLAGGLADGLEAAFADAPGVVVVDASNGSSGLVRDDYHDWQGELPALLDEHEPRVVAVQLGANDGQPMRVDGASLRERTKEWGEAYRSRAERLAGLVEASGAELVWVGAPAFRSRSLTADVVRFNEHFVAATEKVGGAFIDVWEGFVDRNGAYVRSGPDMNGQVVRLRGQDGINLTRAGRRKMAFFAEKDVRRLLGGMDTPGFGTMAGIELPPMGDELMQAPLQPRMSLPIALADDLNADDRLAGTVQGEAASPGPATPPLGGLLAPDDGTVPTERADNFAWPPSG